MVNKSMYQVNIEVFLMSKWYNLTDTQKPPTSKQTTYENSSVSRYDQQGPLPLREGPLHYTKRETK
jgi:hypothetical protein